MLSFIGSALLFIVWIIVGIIAFHIILAFLSLVIVGIGAIIKTICEAISGK